MLHMCNTWLFMCLPEKIKEDYTNLAKPKNPWEKNMYRGRGSIEELLEQKTIIGALDDWTPLERLL